MKRWAAEFKRGTEGLEDGPRSGRPSTATTQENTNRIHHVVMNHKRLTVNHIANVMTISVNESGEHFPQGTWHVEDFGSMDVPVFDTRPKLTKLVSETNLAMFEADPDGFIERFLTQDECWVHHFKPETKRQTMQWKHSTSPAPKKAKVVPSAGKVMASAF